MNVSHNTVQRVLDDVVLIKKKRETGNGGKHESSSSNPHSKDTHSKNPHATDTHSNASSYFALFVDCASTFCLLVYFFQLEFILVPLNVGERGNSEETTQITLIHISVVPNHSHRRNGVSKPFWMLDSRRWILCRMCLEGTEDQRRV